ncbi:MAG: YceI family protein, partial [Bacteroidota bacterium]
MKTTITAMIAIFSIALFAFTAPIATLKVDASTSQVTWKGYKVTGNHEGTIDVKSGSILVEDGKLVGGNFVIDVTSLKCTDLSGGMAGKLEGHLKSPDFFGVEDHPEASFVITKIAPRGPEGSYKVTGDITIKGVTKEIRFNTQLTEENGSTVATANLELD